MTDEVFTFREDLRKKFRTARGAHNRRTHTGRGGAMKTPYDYMTAKGKKAMNGKVKSYRLNEPMSFIAFKRMPKDIQKQYLYALRVKYGVSFEKLASMFGICKSTVSSIFHELELPTARLDFDREGWERFARGLPAEETGVSILDGMTAREALAETAEDAVKTPAVVAFDDCGEIKMLPKVPEQTAPPLVPTAGTISFEGKASEALKMVALILRDAHVKLTVEWDKSDALAVARQADKI